METHFVITKMSFDFIFRKWIGYCKVTKSQENIKHLEHFAVSEGHRVKMKEGKNIDKYLDFD